MNSEINSILFARKSKVQFKAGSNFTDPKVTMGMLGAIIGNFSNLGYVMSTDLHAELLCASPDELVKFYAEVYPMLANAVGATYRHKPMYPNFPQQVMEASDAELYVNQVIHYIGAFYLGETILPEYTSTIKFPFCELTKAKWLGLATETEAVECFGQILSAKSSPSVQDKADITTFLSNGYFSGVDVTNKETLAFAIVAANKNGATAMHFFLKDQLKTATDVLRVAVVYSNGDVSLEKKTRFAKFSRKARKGLLAVLETMNADSVGEDMMRFRSQWVRLGEILHPLEYKNQFPKTADNFSKIRNEGVATFNSKVERALTANDFATCINLLKTRPGDFARRLNALMSKVDVKTDVMTPFKEVAEKVSTPVLWQLYGYFAGHKNICSFRNRLFVPKTSPVIVAENNLKSLGVHAVGMAQIVYEALKKKYSAKPSLGKVWVDPICENLLIPTGNRTASKALRQVGRGSRFPLAEGKDVVRLFIYWKDQGGNRVDLDLSAVYFDADFNYKGSCDWSNYIGQSNRPNAVCVYSGDIVSAPEGASEFLDINLNNVPADVRYIACNVYNYTSYKMSQMDVAFAGWMAREGLGSGEIYEPKSVEGRCDLTADAVSVSPMMVDVQTREIIWTDMAMQLGGGYRCVANSLDKATATADMISRMSKTRASLEDLFYTVCEGTGSTLVSDREDADYVIAEDGDLSPFDVAKIMSEWV